MWAVALVAAFAAVGLSGCLAAGHLSCDCRLWHLRDTSVAIHCTSGQDGASGVSCQKAEVVEIPRGYHHVPGYGLVRLSRIFKPWAAAEKTCEDERAHLAVPTGHHDYDGLKQIFAKVKGVSYAYLGITDRAKEGQFVDIHGRPVSGLPSLPSRPHTDSADDENCVILDRDGSTGVVSCQNPAPFFCERRLSVGVPDSYVWIEDAGRFYKVHTELRAHEAAASACRSENATLAVADTSRRAEAVLSLLQPKIQLYLMGFTDKAVEGDFITETGRHLKDMEFQVWKAGEPKNKTREDSEDCLALSDRGFYDDVRCDLELPFVCEIVPINPPAAAHSEARPDTAACHTPPPGDPTVSLMRSLPAEVKGRRLIQAAKEGAVSELQSLLAAGADLEARDDDNFRKTALIWAAEKGHVAVARCLLRAGAEVDARDGVFQATPLHWAAREGHAAVARQLLEAGADANARNDIRSTPLLLAAEHGHLALVRLLLAHSSYHSAKNRYGWTPLHFAARNGHAEMASTLLEAGADKGARNGNGKTPLDLARENSHQQLIDLLS
ncbi:uncharacterized protein LOC126106664 [Schistocerca cancellata]|uniref:uncharacterized protein LOC126106664 n=1 Tax=Schistocerca cancellata TaxID=274614 RepID=UPI0021188D1B|nr:uncharacterized protein LOC126106664 [Schistocerca cancellata]